MGLSLPKRLPSKNEDQAPGLIARRFAADALLAILHQRRSLEEAFEIGGTGATFRSLEDRDRGLVRMIVATALRRVGSLQAVLERYLEGGWPEDVRVHGVLLSGAAQILLLDVPDHAAVDLSVRLASEFRNKRYAGLVNAVLRRVATEGRAVLDTLDPAIDTPEWLRERWLNAYGRENLNAIAEAHRIEPALDITPKENPAALAANSGRHRATNRKRSRHRQRSGHGIARLQRRQLVDTGRRRDDSGATAWQPARASRRRSYARLPAAKLRNSQTLARKSLLSIDPHSG